MNSIEGSQAITPWQIAIDQMRQPDAPPPPMAREDRNTLIFGAARRLIANSLDGRCRLYTIHAESGVPMHYVRYAIYASDDFKVSKQADSRALWVSLASARKSRKA